MFRTYENRIGTTDPQVMSSNPILYSGGQIRTVDLRVSDLAIVTVGSGAGIAGGVERPLATPPAFELRVGDDRGDGERRVRSQLAERAVGRGAGSERPWATWGQEGSARGLGQCRQQLEER